MDLPKLEPHAVFSDVTDEAWLQVLIDSLREPVARDVRLPGFPPESLQRQFVGSAGVDTLREAFQFYRTVKGYSARERRPIAANDRILDFGCGWGRMVRLFLKDVLAGNIVGVDVDPDVVAICKATFPYGTFRVVPPVPPTDLPAGHFDIAYAYSVFSHLNEPTHLQWVRELARILKPGGLLLVTTQGRNFIHFCASIRLQGNLESGWHQALARSFTDPDAALAAYDRGEFLHEPTGGGDHRPASFYGETLIPRGYVERRWSPYLALVDFRDDPTWLPQALIVMRKR